MARDLLPPDLMARLRQLEDEVGRLKEQIARRRLGLYHPLDAAESTFPPRFDPPVIVVGEPLPLPPPNLRAGYWPDDDATYLASGRSDHDEIIKRAGSYLDLQQPLRILDTHCLSGRVLRHFETERQAASWLPHGIDSQAVFIEWMRGHWPAAYEVSSVGEVVPHLPFEDNYFDIIYGIDVFTHIKHLWDAWLSEFRRVLKPGGVCLLTVHCETAWRQYARADAAWQIAGAPDYVRRHPKMDVDYLLFDNAAVSNTFYKREVIERLFGRYMPVREVLDPPPFSFQDWVVMQKPAGSARLAPEVVALAAPALVTFDEAEQEREDMARREAELMRRIAIIAALSKEDVERMGLDRLTREIGSILRDPVFVGWPAERQAPMIERVTAICTGYWHASGALLIPALEALFRRAVALPGVAVEILCQYYQLLYFLYFSVAARPSETKGFADNIAAPFAAAIRDGTTAIDIPAAGRRPLAGEPYRIGYLSQFAHGPRDSVGQFADHVLGGLSRHFPGRYHPVLYAWSEWSPEALGRFKEEGVEVRRFDPAPTAELLRSVAAAVAQDRIDILITDQNAWLPTVLFERRAAPVQIYYLVGGLPYWPLENIDAVFRIDVYDPRLDGFDPAICFPFGLGPWDLAALAPPVDDARVAAERARFPAGKRLIGNYGRLTKIADDFLAIAAELLARHDDLAIVLGGTGDGGRIRDFIAARGLADRLILIDEYVDGHVWGHMLEMFLDTFPVEGGVSRREMMAKGRPVVTMRCPWSEVEGMPPLVAGNRAAYIDIVSRLLDDPEFYRGACAATREFVAASMTKHDYAAAVDDALGTIIRRHAPGPANEIGRPDPPVTHPETGVSRRLTAESLVYRSVLDTLRAEAPATVRPVTFEGCAGPVDIGIANDVLYLPELHLQVWRDNIVPSETDTTDYALFDLREFIQSGKIVPPASPLDCQVVEEEAIVISNLYSINFYHFLEALYQVLILERAGFEGLYVLGNTSGPMSPVARALPSFQRELLELLGIAGERIVTASGPTVFRSACFTTRVAHTEVAKHAGVFRALRDALRAAAPADHSKGRRLWLKRGRYRGLVNAEEVYACVERYGFAVIEMSHLPVAEQIAAARDAELLGGAHGAAMLHAMFANKGATIVECFSPEYVNPCLLQICRLLDHRYYQLVADNSPLRPYPHGHDVEIDLDRLVPLLDRVCA